MYQKTVLSNHLKIVTHDMRDRDSVSLGVWIKVGGRYEDDRIKGAAHFLEHILFKGSKKYSCEAIKEQIEGVGGTLNAFTAEEYTCYFAKIPAKYFDKTLDIFADMVFDPLIAKKDVEKERTVILEEIKMYHDLPQHYVLELLDELMWPNHPLGKNLAGTFESIGQMKKKDLREFHQNYYFPGNIVISACGRLTHNDFVKTVQRRVARNNIQKSVDFLEAENSQEKPNVRFSHKETEQMHLALGTFGLESDHEDKHTFQLLNIIFGANMSSRLFSEVREKRGLAYAISSAVKSLKDTGMLLIRAGVDNKKIAETLRVILDEIKKMTHENVTKDEFVRAKEYYIGQILLSLEDTLDHMFWLGEPMVTLEKTRTIEEILKEVKKVTIADIKRVAQNIFQDKHLNLAVVGPLKSDQERALRRQMGLA